MELREKLWNEVLEYQKHNKIAYLTYRLIAVRDNVICCKIFCRLFVIFCRFFLDAIKLNSSTNGNHCETDNFENLIYVASSNTEDILLDNICGPDKDFFNANVYNLNMSYILP